MFGRKKKKQTPALFGSRIEPDCAFTARFMRTAYRKNVLRGSSAESTAQNFNMTHCAASRKANKSSGSTAPRNSNYENLS